MVWSDKTKNLSDRLQIMADRVSVGERIADIGADHGYLGLYLFREGISPFVVMTDISEASLSKAKAASGASQFGSGISFRVGDGLKVIEEGEVDCAIIAGMGGMLIRDILAEDMEKTGSIGKFILQPRSGSGHLRKWLLEAGFSILREDIAFEGEFLPEIITASLKGNEGGFEDFDYFDSFPGMDLAAGIRDTLLAEEGLPEIHFSVPIWMLNAGGPVKEFLQRKIDIQEDILRGLSRAENPDGSKMDEVKYNIDYLDQLLQLRKLREQHEEEAIK